MKNGQNFLYLKSEYNENVIDMIVEIAGDSLFHVNNEIEKISLNINDGRK